MNCASLSSDQGRCHDEGVKPQNDSTCRSLEAAKPVLFHFEVAQALRTERLVLNLLAELVKLLGDHW